ncbi:DNA-binding transcriptional regulator, CsgD family [Actinoplanes regularis]|uniref:DNA-binding transcriptional regulator, CsgD family n=2 Tax=Actinoplanes regularis TaxID=52697 RepID=A0A239ILK2_9ACTN|nr:DNA-binding transcriptional regulator, CsgD family [Actinoplanes regularis]
MHFARAEDGVTIGYQVFGQGPVLVWMPSLSNILAQWRIPAMRATYTALARNLTVVLYDGRGMGSSDRRIDLADLGVEAHLRDLRAVLDTAGLRKASLLGYYHAVATAIAFSAREPERVDRLVLFGGAPRMSEAMRPAQTQALLSLVEQDWGLFADAAAAAWLGWDSAPSGRWTAAAFRTATTAPVAKAWFEAARHIDVTGELGRVRAPALVLHRQNEQQIPVEVFRRLAGSLPDARLVELPGTTPTLFMEDSANDVRLVTDFVTGAGTGAQTPPTTDFVTGAGAGAQTHPTTDFVTTAQTGAQAPPTPAAGLPPGSPAARLTPREVEVLGRLAVGDANLEIARRLGIAVHTVERHLGNIYRKIGARGRTDAVAYALHRMPETRHPG